MNSTINPALQLNCPCGTAKGSEILMCLPGAIAGTYYCGMAGCIYGAVKGTFVPTVLCGGVKTSIMINSKVVFERSISPCVAYAILNGLKGAIQGLVAGCCIGGICGSFSAEYLAKTGNRLPDLKMNILQSPNIQFINRT